MRPELEPPELISPQQAVNVGYSEGRQRRGDCLKVGVVPSVGNLGDHREISFERPYRLVRAQSLFYEQWWLGFDAGFLGGSKPAFQVAES